MAYVAQFFNIIIHCNFAISTSNDKNWLSNKVVLHCSVILNILWSNCHIQSIFLFKGQTDTGVFHQKFSKWQWRLDFYAKLLHFTWIHIVFGNFTFFKVFTNQHFRNDELWTNHRKKKSGANGCGKSFLIIKNISRKNNFEKMCDNIT